MTIMFDTLIFRISKCGAWRRGLATKYPDDSRILAAAAMLDALAATPEDDVDPDLWAKLLPYLSTKKANEVISLTLRTVGFSCRPKSLDDLLELFLAEFRAQADDSPQAGAALANVLPSVEAGR